MCNLLKNLHIERFATWLFLFHCLGANNVCNGSNKLLIVESNFVDVDVL